VPTRLPVMVRGEAVWPVVCATLVRDIQAKMPEDDDEPDDEPEDKPDDESEDKSEDDPGTLYFRQKDGWPARSCWSPTSRPSRSAEWTPGAGGRLLSDKVTYPKSARPGDRAGVPPLGHSGSPEIKTSVSPRGGVLGKRPTLPGFGVSLFDPARRRTGSRPLLGDAAGCRGRAT